MSVAAVVVTYNRKIELAKNIEAILSQSYVVDKYYIIDNHGSDNTYEYLHQKKLLDNDIVEYIYLENNVGGAGGFFTGLKMAYEDGYDFICLMDDDGRPMNQFMMKNLISAAEEIHQSSEKLLINSLVLGNDDILSFGLNGGIRTKQDAIQKSNKNMIFGTINPFNGTLVSKELIDEIGFPNKDFFIKGDEDDYYRRALKANAYVATICNSLYYHPRLERKTYTFLGKKKIGSTEAPWKEYYRARNYTYMFKRDKKHIKCIKQNCRQIYLAIKFNSKKSETIKMILKGMVDGLRGNLGPTIKP